MTSYFWNSATSGSWNTAAKWTPAGGPPGDDDTATIAAAGAAYTVQVTSADAVSAFALSSSNATLSVSGPSASLTVSGEFSMSAGVVDIGASTPIAGLISVGGAFDLSGGTLALLEDGQLSLGGTLSQTGGTLNLGYQSVVSGGTIDQSGGTIVWNNATLNDVTFVGPLMLTNFSGVELAGGTQVVGASGSGPGIIDIGGAESELSYVGSQTVDNVTINLGGANSYDSLFDEDGDNGDILTLAASTTVNISGEDSEIQINATLINLGEIDDVQTTYFNAEIKGDNFENEGEIDVKVANEGLDAQLTTFQNGGLIDVANGGQAYLSAKTITTTSSSVMEVEANSSLTLQSTATSFVDLGSVSIASGGSFILAGLSSAASFSGVANSGGIIGISGTYANSGETLDGTAAFGQLTLDNGTISGGVVTAAGVAISGNLNNSNSFVGVTYEGPLTLSLAGTGIRFSGGSKVVDSSGVGPGVVNVGGGNSKFFLNDTQTLSNTIVNLGFDNTTLDQLYQTPNSTTATLAASTIVNLDYAASYIYASNTIINDGVINDLQTVIGASYINGTAFTNAGTINATTSDASLIIDPTNAFTNSGELAASGGGSITINPSLFTNLASSTLTGGVYEAEAGSTIKIYTTSSNTIETLQADVILDGAGSAFTQYELASGTSVALDSTLLTVGAKGELQLLDGRGWTTAGAAILNDGVVTLGGGIINATAAGASLTNATSALISGFGTVDADDFQNSGTLEAEGGVLTLQQSVSGSGTSQIDANATLTAEGALAGDVTFTGDDATLGIDDLAGFSATIGGFHDDDVIFLSGVTATSASVNASNQLVVTDGATTVATLDLDGPYTNFVFGVAAVAGGSDVVALPEPATVAQYLASSAEYDAAPGGFAIDDTAANISANISALNDSHIASITATGGLVIVPVSTFLSYQTTLDKIVGGFEVEDSLPNIVSHLSALNGDGHVEAINGASGSATLTGGVAISVPSFTLSGAGTTLTVGENLSLSNLTLSAATKVSISSGDTLALTGAATLSGTIAGAGMLVTNNGSVSLSTSPTVAAWSSVGEAIVIASPISYSGAFSAGSGDVLTLSGGVLVLKGATSLSGGAFAGSQRLQLQGATTLSGAVTFGGSSGATIFATLTETGNGAITLGDASGAAVNLANLSTGVIDIVNNNGVALGNTAASTISNSGLIEKTAGAGLSVISASVTGAGGINSQIGALELTGAFSVLSGALTGAGKIYFAGGGTTTLSSGVSLGVAGVLITGTGTTIRLQTNLSYGGSFSQVGGTSLTMISAITLTLTGISSLGGTIFGSSTLAMTGGASTVLATAKITTGDWTSAGTAMTISGAQTYSGVFSASAETITLNAVFSFAGQSTFTNDKLAGSNQLRFGAAATISGGLTLGGATSLANFLSVTQSGGDVVMGDSANGVTKIINTGAATNWNITDNSSIDVGNSAASSINNTGVIEKSGGGGLSTIEATLVNGGNGKIEALSGTLDLQGAISGKGYDIVSGAATLQFDSTVASTQTVEFQGADSLLDLTNWGAFSGVISGFDRNGATGDTIDVASPWTYVGFNQSTDMMTFADGAAQHAVKLTGSYLAADFHATAVTGGTQITYG